MRKTNWTTVGQEQPPVTPPGDADVEPKQISQKEPPKVVRVKIADIKIGKRLRLEPANEKERTERTNTIQAMAASIKRFGLLHPISIDAEMNLIAGETRIETHLLLGLEEIDAIISDRTDPLDEEILQIHENLMRLDLHYADRGLQVKRLEEIDALQHPKPQAGADAQVPPRDKDGKFTHDAPGAPPAKPTPTFVQKTSQNTGYSERTVQEDLQIAKNLPPETLQKLKEQDRPKKEAITLAQQPPTTQKHVTDLMEKKPKTPMKVLVKEAKHEEKKQEILKSLPKPIEASKAPLADFKMYWGDMFTFTKSPGTLKYGTIPLIITSPPYGVGKDYAGAGDWDPEKWPEKMALIAKRVARELTDCGVFALVLGTQPRENKNGVKEYIPLDTIASELCRKEGLFFLRRVFWTFNAGKANTGGGKNLNGRYETVSFFVKGLGYTFNLKDIKVPPKDPTELRNSADGVNPGDKWDFIGEEWHFERTTNMTKYSECIEEAECILPYEMVERIIKLFSKPGDVILDPFAGSAIVMRVAADLGRKAIAVEINKKMADVVGMMMNPIPFAQEDI